MISRSTLFFFNDTATTEIYTLSLHDALPISADPRQLGARDAGVPARVAIEGQPRPEPDEVERPGREKRPAPAQREGNPRDQQGGQHHAHVAARVEDPGGEGPLALREPLRYGLHGGREVAGLADPEQGARHAEAGDAAHQRMPHRGQTPQPDGD